MNGERFDRAVAVIAAFNEETQRFVTYLTNLKAELDGDPLTEAQDARLRAELDRLDVLQS